MRNSSFVFLAAFLISAPALAQVGAANNPVPNSASDSRTTMSQPTNPPPTGDASLDEVVCKTQPPPTGTRIGSQRVCKTQREWLADEDAMNRARSEQDQNQNLMQGASAHSMGAGGH
jgi:hypothetical protein